MKFLFVVEPLSFEWLGIDYISAVLKKFGVETKLFITGENINEIFNWKPDYVGYSVLTGSHRNLQKFNSKLKEKINFISVFGGPHPTYFPEIIKDENIDYVIRGEGEEIIEYLLSHPKEKIILGTLPQNLDKIPFPDRELIYNHLQKERNNPIRHFIASRGCPFDCPYCYNSVARKLYKGQRWVRFRSPENVIEEIEQVLKRYGGKFLHFQDDCFNLNKKWLKKFLPIYKKKIGLPFHCIVRLDLFDEDIVKNLKEANCYSVRCAIECGNDEIRNKILKRNMSKQQIFKETQLLHKYNIKFVLQNILCLPNTDLKIDLETLLLNIKCRPTLGWASIFQPYPGTELGSHFPRVTIDNINPSFYEDSPINVPNKKMRLRLQKLFGIITRYPTLKYLWPLLLRLPVDNIYRSIWRWNTKIADKKLYSGLIR